MTGVPIGGRRFARGARVGRVVSTPIANAFDPFEFSGTVEMSLSFDPDIAIDSNACNNDANAANNTFRIDGAGVQAFLGGTALLAHVPQIANTSRARRQRAAPFDIRAGTTAAARGNGFSNQAKKRPASSPSQEDALELLLQ